jgi:hypothetical protein
MQAEAIKLYQRHKARRFRDQTLKVRDDYLLSQLYLTDNLNRLFDELTLALGDLSAQQLGTPMSQAWTESQLTAKIEEVHTELYAVLSRDRQVF